MAFRVCVVRGVVDFSCPGGQIEAFRCGSEAFGGHFGGQKPFKHHRKTKVFCMLLENGLFSHSSRSDPFLSSILDHFGCSCGPFGALLWLFLACFGPSEGPCWILCGVFFWCIWCVGGVWSVCLACCRRLFVSWRLSRGFQRRFGSFWLPFRRPKTFNNH